MSIAGAQRLIMAARGSAAAALPHPRRRSSAATPSGVDRVFQILRILARRTVRLGYILVMTAQRRKL
jgi:hypothetical protein